MTALPSPAEIRDDVRRALDEDIGTGDLTAALIDPARELSAEVRLREPAILCGSRWFDEVFRQIDAGVAVTWLSGDGDEIESDAIVCTLTGRARAILTGERAALNFLQTLSATATATRRFVRTVEGTGAKILDTRKTLPGLRLAQKYAVRCGGGNNHRVGLFDAILIKENHIAAFQSLNDAVSAARANSPEVLIEVEVENLDQVRAALASSADRLLLDNFSIDQLREAVELRNRSDSPSKELEASGGIGLSEARAIAETGVDWLSIGQLTKNLTATDFSLRAT